MMTTTDSTFDTFVIEMRHAEAEAQATDCGVQGCDGTWHEPGVDPQNWHHQVESTAGEILQLDMMLDDEGRARAHILSAFDDETFAEIDGDAVRALADKLEAEPARLRAFADRLDRRSLPEQRVAQVAANVRGNLTYVVDDMRLNAKPLAEILEVSESRARDLYYGRAPFTLAELGLLSAYFDCDVHEWMGERGPHFTTPMDLAAAEDRVMTARESAGQA